MSDYIPRKDARVVIGVCGEQGSGKTVFLTCIFQSIWSVVTDDLVLDFDRRDVGNALHFQEIEDLLRRDGPVSGTLPRSLVPARLFIKPYDPLPGDPGGVLSVDLLDFAGRHFRSLADPKRAEADSHADPEDLEALHKVDETLKQADAYVILINSKSVDPESEAPGDTPFTPSVNFMLAHCRNQRKPVALLFTQVDQTPGLTPKVFGEISRVEAFRRQFTESVEDAGHGIKPFGIARAIFCYQTLPGDVKPRLQGGGGNIWCEEPAEIVLSLLRAAMPAIRKRLEKEAEDIERDRLAKELSQKRAQRLRWSLAIAAGVLFLVLTGTLVYSISRRTIARRAAALQSIEHTLHEGNLADIPADAENSLDEIVRLYRSDPGGVDSELVSAMRSLETAFALAGQQLVATPLLEPAYRKKIERYQALARHFDPAVSDLWKKTVLPTLAARNELLADWLDNKRPNPRARTAFLDDAAQRFAALGDRPFSALLAARSTEEKQAELTSWRTQIDADADIPSRIATIQRLFSTAVARRDPELVHLARIALAGDLAATIVKRQENPLLRENVLAPLTPGLASMADGEVRFEALSQDLLNCSGREDCERKLAAVNSVLTGFRTSSARWRPATENLLRSLLFDLPDPERRQVWNALAASLAASYLFSERADAWPPGMAPLHNRIREIAAAKRDSTPELIERLTQQPIYAAELEYLADRLSAMEVRRTVVSIYSTILLALGQRSVLPSGDLMRMTAAVSSATASHPTSSALFGGMHEELSQVLTLVRSVNVYRYRGAFTPSPASQRLERLLRDARRSHCTALVPHQAPPECADAAA